ncbi:MAG: DUF1929 domain-containing protein [Lautropia sp.]|nr:DUF1929 domain-containing protein [Lautropia sp.]
MRHPFPSLAVPAGFRRQAMTLSTLTALLTLAACGGGAAGDAGSSPAPGAHGSGISTTDDRALFRDGPNEIPAPNVGIDFQAEPVLDGLPDAHADVRDSLVARKNLPTAPMAAVQGAWGPQVKWPFIPIHAVVMPDGRVMTYGSQANGQQGGKFFYDVWDPTMGTGDDAHLLLPNTTQVDIFCSAQVVLPLTGDLFIAGGDVFSQARGRSTNRPNNDTTLFRPGSNTIEKGQQLKVPRWYATATTLPNGEVYIQGGLGGEKHPEIRRNDGSTVLLDGIDSSDIYHEYPRNWVAPDGKIFGFSATKMYRMDVSGKGTRRDVGELNYKSHWEGSAVMFEPGRILMTEAHGDRAAIIDIRSDKPVVRDAGRMSNTRMWHDSTVLADGTVAITGGAEHFDFSTAKARNPIYQIELWNPKTGVWTKGPAQKRMRLYHSTSVLLPDGTLFTGGGGAGGPETNLNAEIYYPPYLYNADGSPARRPVIDSAPMVVQPSGSLVLESADAASIQRITMVASGSVTHSFDMNQRFIELNFRREGNRLVAQLPANHFETPPGYYMVFAINRAGTPSVASMVRVNVKQPAGNDPDVIPVYQYGVRDGSQRYRYSTDPALGGEWVREREAFLAYGSPKNNTVPVYRYEATEAGKTRYLYSTNDNIPERGWQRTAVAFHAFAGAGEGRQAVAEYRQYRAGTYATYTVGNAPAGGWTRFSPASFHVPVSPRVENPAVHDTQAPSVPQNLKAEVQPDNSIIVTWDAATDTGGAGLEGYRLRRGPIVLTADLLKTPRFVNEPLGPGQYTYSVEAVDKAGNTSARSFFRTYVQPNEEAALRAANLVKVYRYVGPGGDGDLSYVYSANASLGSEWTRQELAFHAYATPQTGTVPVYRYRARGLNGMTRYLLSIQPSLGYGWQREQVVFHVLRSARQGTQPVHEFYRLSGGLYLGYGTGNSFGKSSGWRRHGTVFHVPTWNGTGN